MGDDLGALGHSRWLSILGSYTRIIDPRSRHVPSAHMGSIRLETLSDYHKHGYDLCVRCRACGHEVIRTPQWFFDRGIICAVARLERRLRCDRCKSRAAMISSTMFGPSQGVRRGARWQDRG